MAVQGRRIDIPDDEVRRVWADTSLKTLSEKAAQFGCSGKTLSGRARFLGLPRLSAGRTQRYDLELVRAAWLAGVSGQCIAEAMDVDPSTISHAATVTLGLPPRRAGYRARLTWDQFFAPYRAEQIRAERRAKHAVGRPPVPSAPRETFSPDVRADEGRRLYQAVLVQAWRDALELQAFKADDFDAAEARRWFGSPDFYTICMFADVNPDKMLAFYSAARARMAQRAPKPVRGVSHLERIAA